MKRILVTDDNAPLADNLAEILEDEGYEVTVTYDPDGAIRAVAEAVANETPFDFVLLDVRLPGMDGVSLHGVLRDRLPDATFVLMTAFSTDERIDAARRAGVRDVLPKPLPIPRLLSALGHVREGMRRVLVVDDDEAVGSWLRRALGREGFEVEWAATAAAARASLLLESFDAAIIDVRLPDENGLHLATELVVGKGLPVVIMSGYDSATIEAQLKGAPFEHTVFLEKPFPADKLVSVLASLGRIAP